MPQAIQHDFAIVVELQAEPVPAALARVHGIRKELVIHPRGTLDLHGRATNFYLARSGEPGQGDIVRCVANSPSLAADSIFSLDDGRLGRCKIKLNGELFVESAERLPGRRDLNLPISVPDEPRSLVNAGDSGAGAVDTLVVIKAAAMQIAERKVCHIQVVNMPRRRISIARYGLAEERQFKTEAAPIGGPEITCVIPPLRLVVGMTEVVARKFVMITRRRLFVVRRFTANREKACENQNEATPHAPPRSDSGARRCAPDTARRPPWPRRRY